MDEQHWPSAITSHSIKQIYLLREMCFIPLAIGPDPPSPLIESEFWYRRDGTPYRFPLFDIYSRNGRRGKLGSLLQERLEWHQKRMSVLYKGEAHWVDTDPWFRREESRFEGFAGFHLLWDHEKDQVKSYCLARVEPGGVVNLMEDKLGYERKQQWAESSEEEGE
jgi:hypothetical protein